ncbi:hypothetical protein Vafri_15174 [Volvox africanus]|nr:hypothetical protein Vafri_15174 [Volvox africanus]
MSHSKNSLYFAVGNYLTVSSTVIGKLQRKGLVYAISDDPAERAKVVGIDDQKACGIIKDFIAITELASFEDKTAKALWDSVKSRYAPSNRAARMELDVQLSMFAMKIGESARDYLRRFRNLRSDLLNSGKKISEEDAITYITNGLPSSWAVFKRNIIHLESVKTVDQLEPRLLTEEKMIERESNEGDYSVNAAGASTSRRGSYGGNHSGRGGGRGGGGGDGSGGDQGRRRGGRNRRGGGNSNGGGSKNCYWCGESGHLMHTCPDRIAGKPPKGQAAVPPAAVAPPQQQPQRQPQQQPQQQRPRNLVAAVHCTSIKKPGPGEWLLDTGAEVHLTGDVTRVTDYQPLTWRDRILIVLPDGSKLPARGTGKVFFQSQKYMTSVELQRVYVVPGLGNNLFSIKALKRAIDGGVDAILVENSPHISVNGEPGLEVFEREGMYYLRDSNPRHQKDLPYEVPVQPSILAVNAMEGSSGDLSLGRRPEIAEAECKDRDEARLFHRAMGHCSYSGLRRAVQHSALSNNGVTTFGVDQAATKTCEPCVLGKQTRASHPLTGSKSEHILDLVHMDLCGLMNVVSKGGKRYFVTFYDDCSKYSEIRCVVNKSDTPQVVKEVIKNWETQTGLKLRRMHTDRGLEYCNTELSAYCAEFGVEHEKTAPYTPEQNGAAERLNRTLLNGIRTLLADSGLSQDFWAEAAYTVCLTRNLVPPKDGDLSPWELFTGKKPDASKLRIFGSTAYVHVPCQLRKKLDPVSKKGVMVGYERGMSAWRIYVPTEDRIYISCDVVFREGSESWESESGSGSDSDSDSDSDSEGEGPGPEEEEEEGSDPGPDPGPDPDGSSGSGGNASGNAGAFGTGGGADPPAHGDPSGTEGARRTSSRTTKGKPAWRYADEFVGAFSTDIKVPTTYEEAMASPYADEWRAAMEEEIASLRSKGTWSLEEEPPDARALGTKWVFSLKFDQNGAVERFKARLVVKGFMQREGIDFEEVFAPVSKHATLRAFLAMVAANNMELHQLDVKTAFLNGELEEEVFVKQPPGFEEGGPNIVGRLHKALYGLRQASRAWYKKLHDHLMEQGYRVSEADPSLYVRERDGVTVYVLVYVDDVLIASTSLKAVIAAKAELMSQFECRDMGEATMFLGMLIKRDRAMGYLSLSQPRLIEELVQLYGMGSARSKPVPMAEGTHLAQASLEERLDRERYPYSELIGSLLYISGCTRPDISQAVGVLTRHMAKPAKEHWKAAKEVVRYLLGTADFGLAFGGERAAEGLLGFCDADHAGCVDTRRSTTGYVFSVHGCAVSWASKLQRSVAVSTMEAEYVAASEATKEALWLRQLLTDMGYSVRPTKINCDSQSALKVIKNPVVSTKSKHIAVRYHLIREQVMRGSVEMVDCRTDEMVADIFTKPLSTEKFVRHRMSLGVCKV